MIRRLPLCFLFLLVASGAATAQPLNSVVVFGENSVYLKQNATILNGEIVANTISSGPTLACSGREMCVGNDVTTPAGFGVYGDSIQIKKGSVVNGDAYYNDLTDNSTGEILGDEITPISLPIFSVLPVFQEDDGPTEGLEDFDVPVGGLLTLDPGSYGLLKTRKNSVVTFTGGTYNFREIDGGQPTTFLFRSPSDIRVSEKFAVDQNSFVGPDVDGEGVPLVSPSDIVIYVAGVNGSSGNFGATPRAAKLGVGVDFHANIYVPNGTLWMRQNGNSVGAFFARDVIVGVGATVDLDFGLRFDEGEPQDNLPVAEAQTLFTNGANDLVITLSGFSPDGTDLVFSIVSGPDPLKGSLGPISPIVPAEVPEIDRETGQPTGNLIQPAITSATVTYTPTSGDNLEDGFTFQAQNDSGIGVAFVAINPVDTSPPAPPLDAVEAEDQSVDVVVDATAEITLDAGAPPGVTLAYSIESLPSAGSLTDSASNAIETVPYALPDATVFYGAGSTPGSDSFDFLARDTTVTPPCGSPDCATATVFIGIDRQIELAEDQTVEADLNIPVLFTLSGNSGGSGTQQKSLKALPGADVAGNVSDATGDGLGDGRDNLPGPTPVLVAAGIDVNLGAASSGSTTDPDNDATPSGSSSPDPDPDVISATVSTDGSDLFLEVRYKAGTFDSTLTRAQFLLDTDQDPNTGHPGTNSGCVDDAGIIGSEFIVDMGGDVNGTDADVSGYNGTCNSFSPAGSGTVTYVTDGMDATLPLSLIGGDDGKLNYKVTISEQIDPGMGGSTGVLDTMPDVGLPAVDSNPGVEGVARVQIEWDISGLGIGSSEDIEAAEVTLTTQKGTVDDLDTMFFAGTQDQDGVLAVSDFETEAGEIDGVVMPVPAGPTGTQGTFSFPVTSELKIAVDSGFDFFTIQARVDEQLAGGGFRRGLQVRSTATGNLTAGTEPKLDVVISPDTGTGLVWKVTDLPDSGTVKTLSGALVSLNQTFFETAPTLVYTPTEAGTFSLGYEVTQGGVFDTALVGFVVGINDPCILVGRPPGCTPNPQ